MRKRKILSIITLGVFCTSMLFGCGNTKESSDVKESSLSVAESSGSSEKDSSKSVAESFVDSDSENEEIVPNDAGDFKWHEITADEIPNEAGCIIITGYVGERTNVVIPKSISDKPVVAISEFAFSPFSVDDVPARSFDESSISEGSMSESSMTDNIEYVDNAMIPEPMNHLLEVSGLLNKYQEIKTLISEMDPDVSQLINMLGSAEYRGLSAVEIIGNMQNASQKGLPDKRAEDSMYDESEDFFDESTQKQYYYKEYYKYITAIDDINLLLQTYDINDLIVANDIFTNNFTRCKKMISNEKIADGLRSSKSVSNITSIMIPDSVSYILGFAFGFCDSLESVKVYNVNDNEMPLIQVDSIIGFEVSPFYACKNLKEINFYLNADIRCGTDSCFDYCISLEKIYLYPNESGAVRISSWGLGTLTNLNEIVIEDSCTGIYNNFSKKRTTFSGCKFHIPASVKEIDKHIFCTHINNGKYDYEGSPSVEDCEICDGITIITPAGSYAESYAKENGIPYENP